MKKNLAVAICFFLASAILSTWADNQGQQPSSVSLPNLRSLTPLSAGSIFFGQRRLVSDIYWIKILQYCGDSDNRRSRYSKLLSYCIEAATLDPQFDEVYYFGAVYLAWYVRRPDEATKLLRRGLTVLRDGKVKKQMQLYIAAIQYESKGHDREALGYLMRLVQSGDYPSLLPPILANTLERLGDLRGALEVWNLVYSREPRKSVLSTRAELKISRLKARI